MARALATKGMPQPVKEAYQNTSNDNMVWGAVALERVNAIISLAGRVVSAASQPLPVRIGGFGGVAGLTQYLKDNAITHVIDATHPFATQMSAHALQACNNIAIPLIRFTRPPWVAVHGDDWSEVADIAGAAKALSDTGKKRCRVMLAIGRMHLNAFFHLPDHFYLLRLIDPPAKNLPFPDHKVVLGRGPFDYAGDLALLQQNGIDLIITKNAGGAGAYAKLDAARHLGVKVIMIAPPDTLGQKVVYDVQEALDWLAHTPSLVV